MYQFTNQRLPFTVAVLVDHTLLQEVMVQAILIREEGGFWVLRYSRNATLTTSACAFATIPQHGSRTAAGIPNANIRFAEASQLLTFFGVQSEGVRIRRVVSNNRHRP